MSHYHQQLVRPLLRCIRSVTNECATAARPLQTGRDISMLVLMQTPTYNRHKTHLVALARAERARYLRERTVRSDDECPLLEAFADFQVN